MKTATIRTAYNRPNVRYPNAATRRQILEKFVDNLLIAAMVVAAVTVFLFLLTFA